MDTDELVDNASGQLKSVLESLTGLRDEVLDSSRSLEERLESYQDIIASEVGDTILSRMRNLERNAGLKQLYIKFEGSNPSGSQKDRIAFAQVDDAMRRGYKKIVFATCGNYGVAIAFAASLAGIECKIYIPETYHTKRETEILKFGVQIVRRGKDYEESVYLSSREAVEFDCYDANPGGVNTNLQIKAYAEISYEIYDELRDAPAIVAVPVSNGTTLTGIYRGFVSLYRRGKTSRIPRIIAGSSSKKNPIIVSFKRGLDVCEDLDPATVKESVVNEPLINWHSIDGNMALSALKESQGWASDVSDKSMMKYASLLKNQEGLSVLPASTAGLIALVKYNEMQSLPGDRYVAVITGRK